MVAAGRASSAGAAIGIQAGFNRTHRAVNDNIGANAQLETVNALLVAERATALAPVFMCL